MARGREWIGHVSLVLLLGAAALSLGAEPRFPAAKPALLKVIELKAPDGQILSYRHLAGSTEVQMKGTKLAPKARIKLKVGSRPGFVELDINRGNITGLELAHRFGKDFLTYVMWAVSVDGRASNLGEITFEGKHAISINVTTPYQTFWLMVTAEPDFAVVDPSPRVVLYSTKEGFNGKQAERTALPIKGDLFYYTHYTGYETTPGPVENAPNELLQARKTVELASNSGILATQRRPGAPMGKEEERTREALEQAKAFLTRAEEAYQKNPKGSDVVQFARTAAQIGENARAVALGAVGGAYTRELEGEVARLRAALAAARAEPPKSPSEPPPVESEPTPEPEKSPPGIIANPITWLGLAGWALALLLLLRRQTP